MTDPASSTPLSALVTVNVAGDLTAVADRIEAVADQVTGQRADRAHLEAVLGECVGALRKIAAGVDRGESATVLSLEPDRLFGLPDAELLNNSLEDVWAKQIAWRGEEVGPWVIEEWEELPPKSILMSAEWVAGEIAEMTCDHVSNEAGYAAYSEACRDPEVLRLLDQALTEIANRVTWGQAGKLVAVWDVALVDGEPVFTRRAEP